MTRWMPWDNTSRCQHPEPRLVRVVTGLQIGDVSGHGTGRYRRGKHQMQIMENRFQNSRARAHALAFSSAPFRPDKMGVSLTKTPKVSDSLAPARDVATPLPESGRGEAQRPKTSAVGHGAARPGTGASSRPGTGASWGGGSRPGTSASARGGSRPGTGASVPGQAVAFALLTLWERLYSAGAGDWVGAMQDLAVLGDGGEGEGRMLDRGRLEDEVGVAGAAALWELLDARGTGAVSLESLQAAFRFMLEDESPGGGAGGGIGGEWVHPTRGHMELSPVQGDLLGALRQRIARRWHRGVGDAFRSLSQPRVGSAPERVQLPVLRALLSAVSLAPNTKDLEQLWAALDPAGKGSITWTTLREALAIPGEPSLPQGFLLPYNADPRDYVHLAEGATAGGDAATATAPEPSRRFGTGKGGSKLRKRSKSAPLGVSEAGAHDDDEAAMMRDLLQSCYLRTYAGSSDFFVRHGPIGRQIAGREKDASTEGAARLRPLSSASSSFSQFSLASEKAAPRREGKSVRWGDTGGTAASAAPGGTTVIRQDVIRPLSPPDTRAGMVAPFSCGQYPIFPSPSPILVIIP